MKVEILVDASGSFDLNRINKQLFILQDELKHDDAEVSFLSYGIVMNKKLTDLNFPLSDENLTNFGAGGDNYNEYIKNSLSKKLDKLIFISDLQTLAIPRETISAHPRTQFIVIEANKDASKNDSSYMDDFTKNLKGLPNVYTMLTDEYTSLAKLTTGIKEHSDMEKSMTLVKLTELILSLNENKNPKHIEKVAQQMDDLLKEYPEDEIGQFAQCIAGKRQTLPNSEAVFILQMNKPSKNKP